MNCCNFQHSKLKELRKEKGLSQDELSRITNIPQYVLSKIETRATKEPRLWTVCQLSKFFRVEIEYFMERKT